MKALTDKVVVVTGAGRGIGKAIALACAAEGARVVVADRGSGITGDASDETVAEAVVREIEMASGKAIAASESVDDMEGARQIIGRALRAWGRVDGLVCCAGVVRHAPFLELTEEDFDVTVSVHLKGHFAMYQAALAAMAELGTGGSLIGISSGYVHGDPVRASYRAAKAGVVALTKSVALAGREYGVRANVISPIANTRLTEASNLHFASDPADIAPLATFLLSDRAAGVTGEVFSAFGRTVSRWEDAREQRTARHHARWDPLAIGEAIDWLRQDERNSNDAVAAAEAKGR